jgi:putative CocE/NonD family hydrolase
VRAGRISIMVAGLTVLLGAGSADAAMVTRDLAFTASDGVSLHAAVGGEGSLEPRPAIVEFSPYAPGCCPSIAGPDYNYVQVHARGTGRSDGAWSAAGPRDQQDVAEFLAWACRQPWSDGRLAIYGFSASAIVAYNAMNLDLPCLKTAVLQSGTADLYRDLLYIGGIPNVLPGAVVLTTVGGLALASGPDRAQRPQTALDPAPGFARIAADYQTHPSYDAYWRDRTLEPSRLRVPILANVGFYDVESRGAFEAYKLTRRLGSRLVILGAHDGFPAGTPGPGPTYKRWFDRHLLGIDNGLEREPRVRGLIGVGGREELLQGKVREVAGDDWPLPGTRWTALRLSATRSGTARSLNDGTLTLARRPARARQRYPAVPSNALATDPYTTATVGAAGADALLSAVPGSTELNQAEPTSLTYTTPPLSEAIDAVGPASLRLRLSSTAPETDIHAVVADVWPDGTAHPVAAGRLRTSYPRTIRKRSLVDPVTKETIQPYNDFRAKEPARPGSARDYQVEIWPIGNRFEAGHRIRLYVTGTAAYATPPAPGVNTVTVGGAKPSRLVLPSLDTPPAFGSEKR